MFYYYGKNFKNKASADSYRYALEDFLKVTGISDLSLASADDAKSYVKDLDRRVSEGIFSDSTRNVRIYQLRSLYEIFNQKNIFSYFLINEKLHILPGATISIEEINNILMTASEPLAIRLALICGLSTSEICKLDSKSLFFKNYLTVYGAGFTRTIPIPGDIYNELCSLDTSDKLFMNSKGSSTTPRYFQRSLKNIRYTFQDFRAYAIIHMLAEGFSIKEVSKYTGIIENFSRYRNCVPYASPSAFDYEHIVF